MAAKAQTAKSSKTAKPGKRAGQAKAMKGPAARKAATPAAGQQKAAVPWNRVTSLLVVDGASDAIAWYTKALGAKELSRKAQPDGRLMHAAIQIGDTQLMLADSFGPAPKEMTGVTLHVHGDGIEAIWDKAVKNGAAVVLPLQDQFWGDRYGQLRDPFGHNWSLGRPVKLTPARQAQLEAEAMKHMLAVSPPA